MIDQVREHLRLLSVFHYVVGGIGYLFSLIPVIHLVMGIFFLFMPEEAFHPAPSPAAGSETAESSTVPRPDELFPVKLFGLMFTLIPAVIILSGFIFSTLVVVAGKRLAAHRSHTYCLVMAGVECVFMPFGTVLGVFTILTLLKPEARQLFGLPPTTAIGEQGA